MNSLVRQRARIVRVRRIQHGLAATAAAEAAERVALLETNRERLARMRRDLRPIEGLTSGAALARMGELAMRLDTARYGLDPSIENARALAASLEGERRGARRDQESAEKLEAAAVGLAEDAAERRLQQLARRRRRMNQGDDE
ncbi:hypothetical protein RCO27_13110 [Sphingosinicella sp. LHD-64]|uniref:hypothetical protein n=1 Tax=Sphingosinicella sp. LHD-64 TaxID=3072139 RepID=UPI00281020F5|nr:hypothetical protein [Sphingosinicella sp. LHD-64]MDQ8757164.1 hypothetical protein [Sphingosinicella sp. LHD-64]